MQAMQDIFQGKDLAVTRVKGNQTMMVNRPDGRRYSDLEVYNFCWNRAEPGRPPRVGDHVVYRHTPAGAQYRALITAVVTDLADPNVHPPPASPRNPAAVQHADRVRRDPWPLVELMVTEDDLPSRAVDLAGWRQTQALRSLIRCREARVPGDPGWSWPE